DDHARPGGRRTVQERFGGPARLARRAQRHQRRRGRPGRPGQNELPVQPPALLGRERKAASRRVVPGELELAPYVQRRRLGGERAERFLPQRRNHALALPGDILLRGDPGQLRRRKQVVLYGSRAVVRQGAVEVHAQRLLRLLALRRVVQVADLLSRHVSALEVSGKPGKDGRAG